MSDWRSGDFDRDRLHPVFQSFAPAHAADSLHMVDLKALWSRGKRLLLLDVDNTLVQWRTESFSDPVLAWIQEAKSLGFEICIISNTRRVERLERLRKILGVETVRGRFKPSRAMFRLALAKFKRRREEAIMIGDQMMTDVFGANRAGIDAIWVRKMEGNEFTGTKVNRFIEGLLTGPIYRSLITPVDEKADDPSVERAKPLAERTLVHQVVKFAVVGGSSFVIDWLVRMSLLFWIPFGDHGLGWTFGTWLIQQNPSLFSFAQKPEDAAFPFAATVAAIIAGINSFVLNRSWTFEIRGRQERAAQLQRFVVVSVIGILINVSLSSFFNLIIPGHSQVSATLATVMAAAIAAVWNFVGQRVIAFRVTAK